jgi:hypothetical protein
MKHLFALVLSLIGLNVCAQKVGDVFGGINYSLATSKDESSRNLGTYKPSMLGLGLSYVVIDNVAIEGGVFGGVRSSSNDISGTTSMTLKVKDGYAFSIRPFIGFNQSWGGYAKLGRQYGTQEVLVQTGAGQTTTQGTYAHTVYGLGVSHRIHPQWGITADYTKTKRIASENASSSAIGIGLRYKF